jgi:hypothetical protein
VRYTVRALPSAPADGDGAFDVGVDRDSGGQFNEMVSGGDPNEDMQDLLLLRINNLTPTLSQRTLQVTLYCSGEGQAALRWGTEATPSLGCGASVTLDFSYAANRQPLLITLPAAERAYVQYRLVAAPLYTVAAAVDALTMPAVTIPATIP